MQERIDQELALLRKCHPSLVYVNEGQWVKIPSYPLPAGWSVEKVDVAFQIKLGYPATPPYGFYVHPDLKYEGRTPDSYKASATPTPPLGGAWAFFSWSHTDDWRPAADLSTGSNLLNWVRSFADRFKEGA